MKNRVRLFLLFSVVLFLLVVITLLLMFKERPITKNYTDGDKIILDNYDFSFLQSTPGNSGGSVSSEINFILGGKKINLRSYHAVIRKDGGDTNPQIIDEGKPIPFYVKGVSGLARAFEYRNETWHYEGYPEAELKYKYIKCTLVEGDGNFCESFMTGKCTYSCNGKIEIEILDSLKLGECLDNNSSCFFNNGDTIELTERIYVSNIVSN